MTDTNYDNRLRTFPIDICQTCEYFGAYGTLGDASAATAEGQSDTQRAQDAEYARTVEAHLGVAPRDMGTTDQGDGGPQYSLGTCDACGATMTDVTEGRILYSLDDTDGEEI